MENNDICIIRRFFLQLSKQKIFSKDIDIQKIIYSLNIIKNYICQKLPLVNQYLQKN